jgi:hypothetical protein
VFLALKGNSLGYQVGSDVAGFGKDVAGNRGVFGLYLDFHLIDKCPQFGVRDNWEIGYVQFSTKDYPATCGAGRSGMD